MVKNVCRHVSLDVTSANVSWLLIRQPAANCKKGDHVKNYVFWVFFGRGWSCDCTCDGQMCVIMSHVT